ncbi:hypothetical protein AVEN_56759-1 [Araneus ventricosus]|uniref:Uncharacterized protein n=1 Tax=Araneus ventricosus TaxID=182803 RepID=A0A4Y2EZ52_ARAVE|nr:hypothetical protein AVEN_56759-1 [Araneus ventricosus]
MRSLRISKRGLDSLAGAIMVGVELPPSGDSTCFLRKGLVMATRIPTSVVGLPRRLSFNNPGTPVSMTECRPMPPYLKPLRPPNRLDGHGTSWLDRGNSMGILRMPQKLKTI